MTLCSICRGIVAGVVHHKPLDVRHHATREALNLSAQKGCQFCSFLEAAVAGLTSDPWTSPLRMQSTNSPIRWSLYVSVNYCMFLPVIRVAYEFRFTQLKVCFTSQITEGFLTCLGGRDCWAGFALFREGSCSGWRWRLLPLALTVACSMPVPPRTMPLFGLLLAAKQITGDRLARG